MDRQAEQRCHVIDEIITTEKNYAYKLETVYSVIIKPLEELQILGREEILAQVNRNIN